MNKINKNSFWEKKFKSGHQSSYPWDTVVSFIFNYRPKIVTKKIKVLEVGCGTGNNLWFAAREGYDVTGVDISSTAIKKAEMRFKKEKLKGNFLNCSFESLPFDDNVFDLVIDRSSITCVGKSQAINAINEIYRVVKQKGKFYFQCYGSKHTSNLESEIDTDLKRKNIKGGSLIGIENIKFYNDKEISQLLYHKKWKMLSHKSVLIKDKLDQSFKNFHEYQIVAEKK